MIRDRVAAVREQIARAAARAGRSPEDVALVAVSKTFPAAAVREAFETGLRVFGENKVQEAEGKIAALGDLVAQGARFHLVGHLQGNKAKKAAALFECVHSVDGADLGRRLAAAAEGGRALRVLVQVDLAGEATKHGVAEGDLLQTLESMRGLTSLRVEGLMILPPLAPDPAAARPYFRRLRELRDQALARGFLEGGELSMGMSHDLEVAIEEGATLVRVGTALFGERPARQ
ncbi:MAG: YggS family pyridoxal phosphate-dependent enzyme [Vicinamibacteria bacterium]